MLPSASLLRSRVRPERMLIAKVITAVGLALLLVVGAWSNSHGEADVHASLCLAPGVSAADAGAGSGHHDEATAVDVLTSDAAVVGIAALWFFALLLMFVRMLRRDRGILLPRLPLTAATPRAGPSPAHSILSLTELSVFRT